MNRSELRALSLGVFLISGSLILYELLLTRLFAVVMFAQFAHLALALALLGMGVGATMQHLWPSLVPRKGLTGRLGWLALIQGLLTLLAVWAAVSFPVIEQFETPPLNYQERSKVRDDLLNMGWFLALLPILSAPFAAAGLAFAGSFQRAKEHIGQVYGADLAGGAVGAVIFIPLLSSLAGPDAVFVILISAGLAGLILAVGRLQQGLSAAMLLGGLVFSALSLSGEVLTIQRTAGYSDDLVTYSEWTPLVRLSVHEDERRGTYILLDNTSASQVFLNETELNRSAKEENRSVVYKLHDPDSRVAILAASAGPEVAIARDHGFSNIDAIDIAAEIFGIVGDRFPDSPVNPYTDGTVNRVYADGRAAILRAEEPYDIIQMVHANLWSSAGLLSNTWSPSLLETREAFDTYLSQLSEDGTISFGRGNATDALLRSAHAALKARGAKKPWQHMAYFRGRTSVLLIKRRPWTEAEMTGLNAALATYNRSHDFVFETLADTVPRPYARMINHAGVMTDDRPYLDSPEMVGQSLKAAFSQIQGESEEPMAVLYRSVVIQLVFVLAAGMLFLGVPLIWRGRSDLAGVKRVGRGILYIAGLGYGYLAVEIVLIHELVLFVGHPTYAITAVVLGMLLSSGIGSVLAGRMTGNEAVLTRKLQQVLSAVILFGALQAAVVAPLLYSAALTLPLAARIVITLLAMAPLGLVMGMPFSLGLRILPASSSGAIPWFWAINGWMSVVASLLSVLISRLYGYSTALIVALVAYCLCLAMAGQLRHIKRD
ncbi:MAG: hypothetical protein ACI8RZ_003308 [Myxococcota bacterium]|jgi:hypothetical protein